MSETAIISATSVMGDTSGSAPSLYLGLVVNRGLFKRLRKLLKVLRKLNDRHCSALIFASDDVLAFELPPGDAPRAFKEAASDPIDSWVTVPAELMNTARPVMLSCQSVSVCRDGFMWHVSCSDNPSKFFESATLSILHPAFDQF